MHLLQLAQDDLESWGMLALVGLAHDDLGPGVDRRQRRAHVVRKFHRAGTIDEGVAVTHEAGRGGGEADAHAVMARFG